MWLGSMNVDEDKGQIHQLLLAHVHHVHSLQGGRSRACSLQDEFR